VEWYLLIKPLGIIAYSLFALTLLIGLFMKHIKIKYKFKIHKWLGISALVIASIHFTLVLIYA
jgi:hypothetical protein